MRELYMETEEGAVETWSWHLQLGLKSQLCLWLNYVSLGKLLISMLHLHDGVITHLEPDILECEVKWALESITMKKASGVMEFQLSYFKSWKMMLWKCCTQYASKFGKVSSGHRTGKGQFSFQSQRMFKLTHNCTRLTR